MKDMYPKNKYGRYTFFRLEAFEDYTDDKTSQFMVGMNVYSTMIRIARALDNGVMYDE